VRAPTLVVSARDDGFGTFAAAAHVAAGIADARMLGFDAGGHLLAGHYGATLDAVAAHAAQASEGGRRGE
jgi:predicted alpha/beta hydrolase family esterase